MIFNPKLGGEGGSYLSQGYLSENEHNSTTGIQTRLLWFQSIALTITPRGHPLYIYIYKGLQNIQHLFRTQVGNMASSCHHLDLVTSTRPKVLNQAYLDTPSPPEQILNTVNSSFFQFLTVLITYLFTPLDHLLTMLNRLYIWERPKNESAKTLRWQQKEWDQ